MVSDTPLTPSARSEVRRLLLRRFGLVFVDPPAAHPTSENLLRALDVHLADLGYVMTHRLRNEVAKLDDSQLEALRSLTEDVLAPPDGNYLPLFWNFPHDVPGDTFELWLQRMLVHFFQDREQPCIHCRERSRTHVLSPCYHIVCDRCFDGSNYTACPICNRVTAPSPFYAPKDLRPPSGHERVRLRLLDVGADPVTAARELFDRLCRRTQPLSPTDRDDLLTLARIFGPESFAWIPQPVPVRENRAILVGTYLRALHPLQVSNLAETLLTTATDVLRVIAVLSGREPSLASERYGLANVSPEDTRWADKTREHLRERAQQIARYASPELRAAGLRFPISTPRFPLKKLSRPLRRFFLAHLESLPTEARTEDMLRHRSLWVHVGEVLHPHDYARRYPGVARSFDVLRGHDANGTPSAPFRTFYGRLDDARRTGDLSAFLRTLEPRPGELGRRFDLALRLAGQAPENIDRTVNSFLRAAPKLATPLLLTLHSLLPTRTSPAPVRVFWPKASVALAPSQLDLRAPLPPEAVLRANLAVTTELLKRFGAQPKIAHALIDRALEDHTAPFVERTASRGLTLTRGSRLKLPESKALRLFLHWCEPAKGYRTDIDLSVGFYDANWVLRGVCSYYALVQQGPNGAVAKSSGDLTSAPHPDGAAEYVDIDRQAARAAGFRYAVMLVTAYSGMSFSELERATAGVMLRDDLGGAHFDPRTVELAFDLQGEKGVFVPLAVDLETDTLHWFDAYSPGHFAMNNVATSNRDVARLAPALIAYFAHGSRASLFELGLLHAAARADRVTIRELNGETTTFERRPDEDATSFLARLRGGAQRIDRSVDVRDVTFAMLFRGDLELPACDFACAVFRERLTGTRSFSDLLS
jgi:hypothetical protein